MRRLSSILREGTDPRPAGARPERLDDSTGVSTTGSHAPRCLGYVSWIDKAWECWAVFDDVEIEELERHPILETTPELLTVAESYGSASVLTPPLLLTLVFGFGNRDPEVGAVMSRKVGASGTQEALAGFLFDCRRRVMTRAIKTAPRAAFGRS